MIVHAPTYPSPEVDLLVAGLIIYLHPTGPMDRIGNIGLYVYFFFLLAVGLVANFGPPPPAVKQFALGSLSIGIIVAWAAWINKRRELRVHAG